MLNNLKIGPKIGASFTLALAIFVTIGLLSYRSTVKLIETARWETHTYQVLNELEELISQVKEAETGQRGYVLTGDKRYLEPHNAAIKIIAQNLKDLRSLTADNPKQQSRIDTLEPLLTNKLAVIQETINLRENQGFAAALQLIRTDRGKQLTDNIRQVSVEIETEELELLQQRSRAAQVAAQKATNSITYGIPLSFLLLTLIGFFLTRNISKPLKELSSTTEKLAAGDLSVTVPGLNRRDEIGVLTQTFNQMIANLRETTRKDREQSWLKSNLTKFTRLLQGQRNLETVAKLILSS